MEYEYEKLYLTVSHAGHEDSTQTRPWGRGVRNQYIIHYVISGSGCFECGNKKYKISAGQSFLIVPNQPIYYYPDKKDPWEYVWVNFYGVQVGSLLSKCALCEEHPVTDAVKDFPTEYFFYLVENCDLHEECDACRNSAVLQMILAWYIERFPAKKTHSDNYIISAAIKATEENYYKNSFNVDMLSKLINVNRATLYRSFIKNIGLSPNKFIALRRFEKAAELLTSTDLPIKTISFSTGFENQLHFSKFFKNQCGLSPQNYRTKNEP